jgi:hypothetical protein
VKTLVRIRRILNPRQSLCIRKLTQLLFTHAQQGSPESPDRRPDLHRGQAIEACAAHPLQEHGLHLVIEVMPQDQRLVLCETAIKGRIASLTSGGLKAPGPDLFGIDLKMDQLESDPTCVAGLGSLSLKILGGGLQAMVDMNRLKVELGPVRLAGGDQSLEQYGGI